MSGGPGAGAPANRNTSRTWGVWEALKCYLVLSAASPLCFPKSPSLRVLSLRWTRGAVPQFQMPPQGGHPPLGVQFDCGWSNQPWSGVTLHCTPMAVLGPSPVGGKRSTAQRSEDRVRLVPQNGSPSGLDIRFQHLLPCPFYHIPPY